MSWQQTLYERLRSQPEGCLIGELFDVVRLDIPLHNAMRHVYRIYSEDNMPSAERATWLFFTHELREMVVIRTGQKRSWNTQDHVRLRPLPDMTCPACGGEVYRNYWSNVRAKKHDSPVCPRCQARSQIIKTVRLPPAAREQPKHHGNGYQIIAPPPANLPPPVAASKPKHDPPSRLRQRRHKTPPPLAPPPPMPARPDFKLENAQLPSWLWFSNRRMAARVLKRFFTELSINQIERELQRQTILEFVARRGTNLPYVLRWLIHRGLAKVEEQPRP